MPGKMCHDVIGDKKSIGNWQMETWQFLATARNFLASVWH